jgi:hypothetical protein
VTRADAVAAIAAELSSLLTSAGMAATDTTGNLKEPIDRALRTLGYAASELATATPDDDAGLLALAIYETLTTIVARLAASFDIATSDGSSYRLQQVFANAKTVLEQAAATVTGLYGSVAASGGVVNVDLGFLQNDDWALDG